MPHNDANFGTGTLGCPPGFRPYGPPRMLAKRIVPLIVAVALFMENMDSTVIATSLPAIAADIGTSPLTLKLAVTAYLLSLAVFIPVSGWTADRFGARTVFRSAIAVFMLGSIGCARDPSAQRRPTRADQRHDMAQVAGFGRSTAGAGAWRLPHHLHLMALDL